MMLGHKHYILAADTKWQRDAWIKMLNLERSIYEVEGLNKEDNSTVQEESDSSESDNGSMYSSWSLDITATTEGWIWKRGSTSGVHTVYRWSYRYVVLDNGRLTLYRRKPLINDDDVKYFQASMLTHVCIIILFIFFYIIIIMTWCYYN